ncbi:hypothetical protein Mal4_56500 [Maioricimonas rarisocia]|uniref:Zinc-ribbon domain-containing protein n=1 Tax=Maioricimonas rarisocia TaxID=2528026 RepID=A0A517ZFP9_9PLAN|nr:zinc ribbon domain-containing protein [Maioricimonas rarisocia]QDU41284.1 hypothetical protein Mal4_56500 [Maioricimonas rarisocia]
MSQLADDLVKWCRDESIGLVVDLDQPHELRGTLRVDRDAAGTVNLRLVPGTDRLQLTHEFSIAAEIGDADLRALSEQLTMDMPGLLSCEIRSARSSVVVELIAEICVDGCSKHVFLTTLENVLKSRRRVLSQLEDVSEMDRYLKELGASLEQTETMAEQLRTSASRGYAEIESEPASRSGRRPPAGGYADEEIAAVRGPRHCPDCGRAVRAGKNFCTHCGTPVD